MDVDTPFTSDVAHRLLRPETEDDRRCWSRKSTPDTRFSGGDTVFNELYDGALLRSHDPNVTPSAPDEENHRMLARYPRARLDSYEARQFTLQHQDDHSHEAIWTENTPYISFTSSAQAIQELAERRRRGPAWGIQDVIVVDPRSRFDLSLPILNFAEEMRDYDIDANTKRHPLRDHYLCLWEVTPEEVVGIWPWDELRQEPDWKWFENIVLPAVRRHQDEREQAKQ